MPRYGGILMGDHYAVNESFKGQNAYCNAHTIRTAKEHLLFSKISYAPFTNNLAEQGLIPFKSKMKVIGGFRTREYSDGYCCALSIIQTAIKQKLNPCEILGKIISGDKKVFAF